LIALFVFETEGVDLFFEEERGEVVAEAEKEEIYSEENACSAEID
jgi:hypothetical protein